MYVTQHTHINLIGDIQAVFSDLLLMLKSILIRKLYLLKHYKTS